MKPTKESAYLNTYHKLKDGDIVKIIYYKNCKNIIIEFDYGYKINTSMIRLKTGNFKHPNQITVYGVGFIGYGNYNVSENLVLYDKWKGILRRCYDEKTQEKHPTYIGCSVDKRWHNFQNFAEWFYNNWKPWMSGWHLDKDILIKGNKVYSPETCCFVPAQINTLLINRKNDRGEFPLGVSFNKRDKKYAIELPKNKKGKRNFNTVEEAFVAYKTAKESYIKEVVNEWRDKIEESVYIALNNWKIEITD
jgi:hypothetical protein